MKFLPTDSNYATLAKDAKNTFYTIQLPDLVEELGYDLEILKEDFDLVDNFLEYELLELNLEFDLDTRISTFYLTKQFKKYFAQHLADNF